jgi:DNA repair protein RecN (Recombination protein N)
VDIHGQSEHLSLMRVNQHLGLLDRFSGTTDLLNDYQKIYQQLKDTQNSLARLRQSDLEADQRKDLLAFQIEEIGLASPQEGEEESLIELRNRLVNAEKLADLGQNILILLDDAPSHQPTVMDLVGQVVSSMEALSKTDPALESQNQRTAELSDGLFELGKEVRAYLDTLEFDANELDKTQDRLALLHELKRKYGGTIPEILKYKEQATQQLEEITGRSTRIVELVEIEANQLGELGRAGQKLTQGRKTGAQRLASELEEQLDDLKMAGSRFEVSFSEVESPEGVPVESGRRLEFYPDGLEKIEFLIETNPGEGLKALAKTASGGETARLMLGLKNVLAKADHISTLVFDEIDQGIGGRIGAVVGEKLFRLTPEHQVICITHLPQLAGFGQQHFQVLKVLADGRTSIQVQEINGEERVKELATMLGGPSAKNIESARELMDYISKVIQ